MSSGPQKERADREQLEVEFVTLWSEFGSSIRRLASSYERNTHAREDLLQDIRLAIWMALPHFRKDASLRTFVFRIAHNRGLTHVWRRKKAGFPEEPCDVIDSRADPEAFALQSAERSRMVEAIRGLPLPFRQVMTLVLEEVPYSEIAAVLGISENNVAVRLNRARKLLKESLGGAC